MKLRQASPGSAAAAGPGRVPRVLPSVVVDNCMLWYLFQVGHVSCINICSRPALGNLLHRAGCVKTLMSTFVLEVSRIPLMHDRRLQSKVSDLTGRVKFRLLPFLQDLLQEIKQLKQKVEELEGEKGQYERKLRGTKVT